MKKVRIHIHWLLTAMIGLLLPACGSQKNASKSSTTPTTEVEEAEPVIEERRPMRVLYGIPPEIYQQRQQQEQENETQTTTGAGAGETTEK